MWLWTGLAYRRPLQRSTGRPTAAAFFVVQGLMLAWAGAAGIWSFGFDAAPAAASASA